MNEKMDMASIQTVLKNFAKENMKAEMNQDMVRSEIVLRINFNRILLGQRCYGYGNGS